MPALSRDTGLPEHLRELQGRLEGSLPGGPCELRLACTGPVPPDWLDRALPRLPRARLGPDRWGLGTAWRAEGGRARELDNPSPFATCWFSLRFDTGRQPDARWASFGQLRRWTPRLEWRAGEGLILRLREGSDPRERDLCRRLLQAQARPAPAPAAPAFQPGTESPQARRRFEALARRALDGLAAADSGLDKLVPARRRGLWLPGGGLATELLRRLTSFQRESWPYLLGWGGPCWLGASPERLFIRRGGRLESQALAGTRPRSAVPAEDRRLGRELLHSAKDLREHAVVVDWLGERLGRVARGPVSVKGPGLLRLGGLQHLESLLTATVPREVGDGELLELLHPSPALCGRPRGEAQRWLRRWESQDRGLYGGVLGFRDEGGVEARVAIRGALLQGRRLWLWSGAGLVAGSDPSAEWRETVVKQQSLLRAWEGEA